MTASEDTEITLGTGKLLVLFFGLVGVCALFFALGYSLGRKSEPAITTASAALSPTPTSSAGKSSSGPAPAQPMTFYKSVEQKDANPELTPAADSKNDSKTEAKTDAKADTTAAPASGAAAQTAGNTSGDPATALPSAAAYFVQVAAVSKQEDADALVDALKKKQYPAFVAAVGADRLCRVQVGPFSDVKEAESMRTRLIGDGYSPILKR
jgi:cell division septation protein DedD